MPTDFGNEKSKKIKMLLPKEARIVNSDILIFIKKKKCTNLWVN